MRTPSDSFIVCEVSIERRRLPAQRTLITLPFLVRRVQCELCGNTVPRTRRFLVDRTPLNVCSNCERFGKALETPSRKAPIAPGNVPAALERRNRRMGSKDVYESKEMQLEMVEDFAARIRTAREKKGWTRQELGSKVGEREVTVGRIEAGALRPPDEVARRMELELGIALFEAVSNVAVSRAPIRGFTLGDALQDALKKAKKDEE